MQRKITASLAVTAFAMTALAVQPIARPAMAYQTFMGEDFSCETAESDLAAEIEGTNPPSSAGTIVMLQHLMWMLQAGLNWLDSSCRGEVGYYETRGSWQNSYNQALNTCRQIATDYSACRPQRYR